ncbi:ABC transporter substrate-binding protein [Oligoflexia bacterium]|nr:ABC transporter substrate-binding protein [Oligoflexia bacterium]
MSAARIIRAFCTLAFSLTVLGSGYAETNVIKLGFIGPLSGNTASYGNDERNAIVMAVEKINSSNYIPGKKLEVVFEDGRCSGKDAAIAARKLIKIDKVKIILGGACSGETLAAAPVAEKAKVILYSVFSSHPDITDAGDYIFRVVPSDAVGARAAAKDTIKRGYRTVGIITENSDYAIGFRKVFASAVEQGGLKIVADEFFNPAESDYRSILLRMRKKMPELVLLNPQSGTTAGLLIKQIKELGWEVPLFGTFVMSTADTHTTAGGIKALEGIRFVDVPEVSSERGKRFLKTFLEKYPPAQTNFAATLRYDSVYIIADAIKAVGLNTEQIRDYLYKMPLYEGVAFNYRFDKNGDVSGVPYPVKMIKGGKVIELD